jgi:hypothetical protein
LCEELRPRCCRESGKQPSGALGLDESLHAGSSIGRDEVNEGLAVLRDERVKVDNVADTLGDPIGDIGDDGTTRAVSKENYRVQFLKRKHTGDVVNVCL